MLTGAAAVENEPVGRLAAVVALAPMKGVAAGVCDAVAPVADGVDGAAAAAAAFAFASAAAAAAIRSFAACA